MREDLEELEKLATPLDSASPANAHRNTRARETEGRGGVCSRNNLHASPFGTFDVSGFSKRGYIVANIAKRQRKRSGEEEEADAAARKVSPSPEQSSPYRHPETEIAPVPVLSLPV